MPFERIILLAGKWDTTPVVYNFLNAHFHVKKALIEEPVPKKEFLRKRIRKLGLLRVGGQVLFQLFISRPLAKISRERISEILRQYRLSPAAIPEKEIISLSSVNAEESLQALRQLQPDLVIVHGTRIISKKILQAVPAVFINIHAGITPRYRGVHGAYWALVQNDKEHCGVTVHLVDAGIDTGNILAQGSIPYTPKDNFATYPYLQLAEGLNLLKRAVEELERGEKRLVKNDLDSVLRHHPTLWGYLWKRITRGVK